MGWRGHFGNMYINRAYPNQQQYQESNNTNRLAQQVYLPELEERTYVYYHYHISVVS